MQHAAMSSGLQRRLLLLLLIPLCLLASLNTWFDYRSAGNAALQQDRITETPPLIKGYLRAGAWICGEPAWDPDFNTADLPILLPMAKVSNRYARHYLGQND